MLLVLTKGAQQFVGVRQLGEQEAVEHRVVVRIHLRRVPFGDLIVRQVDVLDIGRVQLDGAHLT